ncbi:hypothetical protein [Argonema antarcticum]|uniref:hypothetical protein n=1 Tax=Argonema antarcticum TaxID=2942763 RepID=UPI0020132385|nr:hypothetical protein [Argonema antarcticum]MCL1471597.1 hypothetical protein [Argonema antarcticum A004/B2]
MSVVSGKNQDFQSNYWQFLVVSYFRHPALALSYLFENHSTMDENLNPIYANQLRRRATDLVIRAVGEPDTPSKSTLDPEILLWCHTQSGLFTPFIM